MRMLRVLGLALVAILAMSALVASTASADEFTAETEKVTLTGTNEPAEPDVLTIPEVGLTTCKHVHYDIGTITTPTTTVTATPTYSECTSLGFPATIHHNECKYIFHVTGRGLTTGDITISCPAGKEITITAIAAGTTKCTIHIPPQTLSVAGSDPVTYTNTGAGTGQDVTAKVQYAALSGKTTKGTGLGACPEKAFANASFTGRGVVSAKDDLNVNPVGIFLSAI